MRRPDRTGHENQSINQLGPRSGRHCLVEGVKCGLVEPLSIDQSAWHSNHRGSFGHGSNQLFCTQKCIPANIPDRDLRFKATEPDTPTRRVADSATSAGPGRPPRTGEDRDPPWLELPARPPGCSAGAFVENRLAAIGRGRQELDHLEDACAPEVDFLLSIEQRQG
jgi:hypothetical protein